MPRLFDEDLKICPESARGVEYLEGVYRIVTAAQLRESQKAYLDLSRTEDVYITRNGKVFTKITNPYASKLTILRSLKGSIPSHMSIEEERTKSL